MGEDTLEGLSGLPVIVGAGLAGLSAALHYGGTCVVLSPGPLGTGAASLLAQGGMAAAIGPEDSPLLHGADTLAAGAGLCDEAVVKSMVAQARDAVTTLIRWGVAFDRDAAGALDLHLEAAHSRPRILHSAGDGSGGAIMAALVDLVRQTPRIIVLEGVTLRAIDAPEGAVRGVWLRWHGSDRWLSTPSCVIATGGVGALYTAATSPVANSGHGLAVAARAGARLADMEFVQFHPTALDNGAPGQRPLVSEAVRGAGAILVDETGARFTEELAARDVVARAVTAHHRAGHRVFLDARPALGDRFPERFPAVAALCMRHGIDPTRQPIPVRPAAHYHMGGIAVDRRGRSSITGLRACGEAACTGLHGANRLASNSLLEAFLGGGAVAGDLEARHQAAAPVPAPVAPPLCTRRAIGAWMSDDAGILREEARLSRLLNRLTPLAATDDHALVGALIARSALTRRESRGSHWRVDYPAQIAPQRQFCDISVLSSPVNAPAALSPVEMTS